MCKRISSIRTILLQGRSDRILGRDDKTSCQKGIQIELTSVVRFQGHDPYALLVELGSNSDWEEKLVKIETHRKLDLANHSTDVQTVVLL